MMRNEKVSPVTQQTQIQTDTVRVVASNEVQTTWSWLKNGNVQLILTISGVVVTLLNLWIASKLSPVASNIQTVADKVQANDMRVDELEQVTSLYLPRYIATEQQVASLKESILRVEAGQIRMEAKIDRLTEN